MPNKLLLDILPQPDDSTCGPTCLHAVYRFYGDQLPLEQVIRETPSLQDGGTLAVLLACHALRRGYHATIYTYNLKVFDPTWFDSESLRGEAELDRGDQTATQEARAETIDLVERLHAQVQAKDSPKLQAACSAYIEFLRLGGRLRMRDLNAALIRHYLERTIPILTGLSSTYLYHCERELEADGEHDDVRGVPTGHFVVLGGYDSERCVVQVADPYELNPLSDNHHYEVVVDRLICAILLGVLTYDANLLVIERAKQR